MYRYFAILTDADPSVECPAAVVRRRIDENGVTHDERYTEELEWAPTQELVQAESGDHSVRLQEISEEEGLRFEAVQYARVHEHDPVDGRYDYYIWVEDWYAVDHPKAVVRRWTSPRGYRMEARFDHVRGWQTSYLWDDIGTGRESGDLVRITEEAARRFMT